MNKFLVFLACLALSSCTADDAPSTFQGQPVVSRDDSTTVLEKIDNPRYPSVLLIEEDGSVGIGVFQPKTGSPVLTLRDDNNDGVFDLLTYSSLSQSGDVLVDVDDYGMDGQADLILNYQEKTAIVYFEGEWLAVDGVGSDSATVMVRGQRERLDHILEKIGRPTYD